MVGGRDAATFGRLYDKVRHLTDCVFYTDDWDAFAKHLPPERHVIGKAGTITIEHDNSNTRHHLGRMTRRTKVVSKNPAWFMIPSNGGSLSPPPTSSLTIRPPSYLSLGEYSQFEYDRRSAIVSLDEVKKVVF
jgi:insertion element IS1 protein InsB